jgi:hypothetical protein
MLGFHWEPSSSRTGPYEKKVNVLRRNTIFEDPPGVDQERLPCRRERDSFALSLKQLYQQFALQLVDLLAKRRL